MTVEDVLKYPIQRARCEDCRYWSPLATRKGVGICLMCGCDSVVHPFTMMAVSSRDTDGVYLVTLADFGCLMYREQS